jgi:flagellar assembly protein FliH
VAILKASEVIYIDPEAERFLLENGEIDRQSSYGDDDEGGYVYGQAIIIGHGAPIDWEAAEAELAEDDSGDFLMGREITIGGGPRERPDAIGASWDAVGYDEQPIYADDEFAEAGPSESDQLIERFSNFMGPKGQAELDLGDLGLLGQSTQVLREVDDKVKQLIDEYRGNVQSEVGSSHFLSSTQRERLMQEAVRQIGDKRDLRTLDDAVNYVSSRMDSLAAQKQEELLLLIEEERVKTMARIEVYVDESVSNYRNEIQQEAKILIADALEHQRAQLENDHELLNSANGIIEQREQILDEAYQKSLSMVKEAEEEVQRINIEIANAEETSRRIFAEAEEQGTRIRAEAQREAERIISEANLESARIIEQAEQSHQEIIEAATQEGFNVGYQEGREEAVKENAQLLAETTAALNKLHGAFPNAVKQNEEKLVRLAMEIAEAVISEELVAKPEIALKTVERAIKRVSDLERVIIKVNPLDLDLILPKQESFRNILPDVQEFVITGHYSIARGGCLIETNSGTVDAQINTQLAVLEEVFARVRAEYDDGDE